jgi:hypothetical protein
MTKYVTLHKLTRAFSTWEYQGNYDHKLRETLPIMNDEFINWYHKNSDLIKNVHKQKSLELDRTIIVLEFKDHNDALMCLLKWS